MSLDGCGSSGRWPDEASNPPLPLQGSLLGSHTLVSQDALESRTAYGDTLLLASPQGEPAWRLSLEQRSTARSRQAAVGLLAWLLGALKPSPRSPRRFQPAAGS
ncbi:MAG: hypothetical protein ACKN89_13475 [Cyanobium sp.]|jgi:hypothetical protein